MLIVRTFQQFHSNWHHYRPCPFMWSVLTAQQPDNLESLSFTLVNYSVNLFTLSCFPWKPFFIEVQSFFYFSCEINSSLDFESFSSTPHQFFIPLEESTNYRERNEKCVRIHPFFSHENKNHLLATSPIYILWYIQHVFFSLWYLIFKFFLLLLHLLAVDAC